LLAGKSVVIHKRHIVALAIPDGYITSLLLSAVERDSYLMLRATIAANICKRRLSYGRRAFLAFSYKPVILGCDHCFHGMGNIPIRFQPLIPAIESGTKQTKNYQTPAAG
jgi:hypothetical protein